MKITELVSENFKRLHARVILDGKSVTVEGKNGVGKSSFIDAVWVALTGKDVPDEPIKKGKDSAKITVTVDGEDGGFVVEKSFIKGGSATLTVKSLNGLKFSSPQKFLDEKIGKISFDPFEFINKPPREQKKFLMELLGIDLSAIDEKKKKLLAEKDEIAKEYLRNKVSETANVDDSIVYISPDEAIEKEKHNRQEIEAVESNIKKFSELCEEKRIIEEKLKQITQKIHEFGNQPVFELPEKVDRSAEIARINENNGRFKQNEALKAQIAECTKIEERGKAKKAELQTLEQERNQIIASAKMPVEGLSFDDDGLLFDGLPFTEEQLSTAKLIEIGLHISMSLNPALRIMRVKDGSLLDSEMLAIIKGAAKDKDYQLFIERVSDSEEIGFIIEE
jgi:recombinational DNA repair ATPase RecF